MKQSSAPMKAVASTVPHSVTVPLLEEKPSIESMSQHEWVERDEQVFALKVQTYGACHVHITVILFSWI